LLVKPQFEAPRLDVGPGGIVTDPDVVSAALGKVAGSLADLGFSTRGVAPSRVRGRAGNLEYFLWCDRGSNGDPTELIEAAIEMRPL
jgi:23S rRNA (cytidine1920-2'-O)/16S rRNA (cytidine1409-2'-O)-methyltransferase